MVVAGFLRAAEHAFALEHLSSRVLVGERHIPKLQIHTRPAGARSLLVLDVDTHRVHT